MSMAAKVAVASCAAAIALAGCGGGTSPAASDEDPDSDTQISVVNISYSPERVEVEVGQKVVWASEDNEVHHTVTSGTAGDNGVPGVSKGAPSKADGYFDGDLPNAGSEFSFTFSESGTFPYFCEVHPSMTGEIVVR